VKFTNWFSRAGRGIEKLDGVFHIARACARLGQGYAKDLNGCLSAGTKAAARVCENANQNKNQLKAHGRNLQKLKHTR
jgi:hypothetical protein